MLARAEKRVAAERNNPLVNTSILQHILGYTLDGLFVSSVSKLWQRIYSDFDTVEVSEVCRGPWSATVYCEPDMTLRQAVFQSPSRLKLALELGALPLNDSETAYFMGVLGSTDTLNAALELGLELSDDLAKGIAVSGRCGKMLWLCEEQQYELPDSIADWAVLSRSVSMLDLVSQYGARFYDTTMQAAAAAGSLEILRAAAAGEHPDVLRWLQEQGCGDGPHTGLQLPNRLTSAGITACHMLSVWSTAHDSNGNDESYKRSYMLVQVRLVCSSTTVSSTQAVLVVARGVVSAVH
eukprot:6583-Heterococcus_DN1.PRE.2